MIQIYRDYITGGGEIIDIFIDTSDELPAEGIINGRKAALGSSATDVSTGNEYRINSNGVWINQSTGAKTIQITQQPESAEVTAGDEVTFTAAASGYSLSYKWQDSSDGTAWTDISGADSAAYTFTSAVADNGKYYRCVVTDGDSNTITSSAAALTVNEPEQAPDDSTEQNNEG